MAAFGCNHFGLALNRYFAVAPECPKLHRCSAGSRLAKCILMASIVLGARVRP